MLKNTLIYFRSDFYDNVLKKLLFTRFFSSMNNCPHCGAELKKGATFCPHCGSDKNTGWKEGAEYSDLDLPDYDEIIENEFGDDPSSPYGKKKTAKPFGIIVATIIVIAFVAAMIL